MASHNIVQRQEWSIRATSGMLWVAKPAGWRDWMDLHENARSCPASRAVLTFNFVSRAAGETARLNCTEVYQRTAAGWRIVQIHSSLTGPPPVAVPARSGPLEGPPDAREPGPPPRR